MADLAAARAEATRLCTEQSFRVFTPTGWKTGTGKDVLEALAVSLETDPDTVPDAKPIRKVIKAFEELSTKGNVMRQVVRGAARVVGGLISDMRANIALAEGFAEDPSSRPDVEGGVPGQVPGETQVRDESIQDQDIFESYIAPLEKIQGSLISIRQNLDLNPPRRRRGGS